MSRSVYRASDESLSRNHFFILTAFALATFIVYLVVGVYYSTGAVTSSRHLSIELTGESYLQAFPGWNDRLEFDDAAYNRAAVETLAHGVPRDHTGALFIYAPIYAYFLAACYSIGGLRLLALAIPQAALSAFICVAVSLTAYRIVDRRKLAALVTAGFLFLINLRIAMYVGYVSPTILLLFFFSVAVLAASRGFTLGRVSIFVAALILAAGTQAGFFIVIVFLSLWLGFHALRIRKRSLLIAAAVLALFGIGKVLLPGLIKANAQDSMNKIGEAVLWEANNPYYESMGFFSLWERRPGSQWTHWSMSAAEKERHDDYLIRADQDAVRAAFLWIMENPGQYAKLDFIRFWTELGPFTGMMSPRNRLISLFVWLLIFPAGIYGWWISRQTPLWSLTLTVALVLIISATLVIVEWYLRYRLPLDLLLTVYAGAAYSRLLRRPSNEAVAPTISKSGVA
jgi:hypothetical protein